MKIPSDNEILTPFSAAEIDSAQVHWLERDTLSLGGMHDGGTERGPLLRGRQFGHPDSAD